MCYIRSVCVKGNMLPLSCMCARVSVCVLFTGHMRTCGVCGGVCGVCVHMYVHL